MKKYLAILGILFTVSARAECVGTPGAPVRSVYIVPQLATSQLYSNWMPILDRVGRDTNQCFELHVPPTIPEFEKFVLSGEADYVYMNPYHAVMAYKRQKYAPLVADGKEKLDGIIVVRKDSKIKSIEELDGNRMAFPAPNAFAASLLIRSTLDRKGIKIQPKYVKTHSNVYHSVILGDFVAGGGINHTFEREPKAVRERLRILYTTPEYTPHPFAANPRIAKATRDAVADSFVALGNTDTGRVMLDRVQMPKPMKVTYENNYAVLDTLGIERFVDVSQ